MCPAAFDITADRCVPHQLATLLKHTLDMTETDIDERFDKIHREMYTPGAEENPYEIETEDGTVECHTWRQAGVTTAMILAFAEALSLTVHVLWRETKITS